MNKRMSIGLACSFVIVLSGVLLISIGSVVGLAFVIGGIGWGAIAIRACDTNGGEGQ